MPSWELDGCGRPIWISQLPNAETAPWRVISRPALLPLTPEEEHFPGIRIGAMPQVTSGGLRTFFEALLGRIEAPQRRRGAPPLSQRPEEVSYAAWLMDLRGQREHEIAYWLRFGAFSQRPKRLSQPIARKVTRYVLAGRVALHDDGVLPWVLWPEGHVPADWSTRRGFGVAIAYWYRFYVQWNAREIALLKELNELALAKARLMSEDPREALRRAIRGQPPE